MFGKWRELIEAGRLQTPFHITHVEAHGDLSMGEIGYKHILTELVRLPAEDRPAAAAARVGDGDYLAYAIGCRWVSELDYVYNEGGGGDVHAYFWENFDKASSTIRLAALTEGDVKALFNLQTPTVAYSEPRVPLRQIRWDAYTSPAPFDLILLARSKPFTPAEADALYEAIPIRTDRLRCRTGSGRDVTIASEHSATRSLGGPKPAPIRRRALSAWSRTWSAPRRREMWRSCCSRGLVRAR